MTPDLDALERKARAATGGQWKRVPIGGSSMLVSSVEPKRNGPSTGVAYDGKRNGYSIALPFRVDAVGDQPGYYRDDFTEMSHDDAAYIAAASPDVVLGLIAELREARAALGGFTWRLIDEGTPRNVPSSPGDNGRRPVLVTRWPATGAYKPVNIACLTTDGWRTSRHRRLRYEPTHWMPLAPDPPIAALNGDPS